MSNNPWNPYPGNRGPPPRDFDNPFSVNHSAVIVPSPRMPILDRSSQPSPPPFTIQPSPFRQRQMAVEQQQRLEERERNFEKYVAEAEEEEENRQRAEDRRMLLLEEKRPKAIGEAPSSAEQPPQSPKKELRAERMRRFHEQERKPEEPEKEEESEGMKEIREALAETEKERQQELERRMKRAMSFHPQQLRKIVSEDRHYQHAHPGRQFDPNHNQELVRFLPQQGRRRGNGNSPHHSHQQRGQGSDNPVVQPHQQVETLQQEPIQLHQPYQQPHQQPEPRQQQLLQWWDLMPLGQPRRAQMLRETPRRAQVVPDHEAERIHHQQRAEDMNRLHRELDLDPEQVFAPFPTSQVIMDQRLEAARRRQQNYGQNAHQQQNRGQVVVPTHEENRQLAPQQQNHGQIVPGHEENHPLPAQQQNPGQAAPQQQNHGQIVPIPEENRPLPAQQHRAASHHYYPSASHPSPQQQQNRDQAVSRHSGTPPQQQTPTRNQPRALHELPQTPPLTLEQQENLQRTVTMPTLEFGDADQTFTYGTHPEEPDTRAADEEFAQLVQPRLRQELVQTVSAPPAPFVIPMIESVAEVLEEMRLRDERNPPPPASPFRPDRILDFTDDGEPRLLTEEQVRALGFGHFLDGAQTTEPEDEDVDDEYEGF